MIRRSFRIGLWLGLLGGLTYAVLRLLQGSKEHAPAGASAPSPSWARLEVDVAPASSPSSPADAAAEIVAPQPRPAPALPPTAAPAAAPEAVAEVVAEVGAIAAPQPAPTPVDRPAPVEAPAAKRPAVKKPAAKKPAVEKATVETAAVDKAAVDKAAAKKAAPKKVLAPWVDPKGGICPKAHPVKAKLSSRIFQVPGQLAYERTLADRCYKDADAAEADGFRAAKR